MRGGVLMAEIAILTPGWDVLSAPLWYANQNGTVVYFNKAWLQFRGKTAAEEAGNGWYQGVYSADLQSFLETFQTHFERRKPFSHTVRLMHRDGVYKWVTLEGQPLSSETGDFLGYIGLCQTALDCEVANQDCSKICKSLFETSHAVILLIDTVTTEIVDANTAACNFYGYSREELTSLKLTDINIQSQEEVMANINQTIASGHQHFLLKHRLASGELRDVEIYSGPIFSDSKPLLFSIVNDVSEQKRAEAERKVSEKLLRSIGDSVTNQILVLDAKANILAYNNPWLESIQNRLTLPAGKDVLVGSNFAELCGLLSGGKNTACQRVLAELGALVASGEELREFEHMCSVQGSNKWGLWRIRRMEAPGEQFIVSHEDITAQKCEETRWRQEVAAAEAANQLKGQYLANVSHEIRTTLNSIIGMGDLMNDTELTSEQEHYVRVFATAGNHLLELINNIMDISKLEAGATQLTETRFSVLKLIEEIGEYMGISALKKGLAFAWYIEPGIQEERLGDPIRLRQVLINLLQNAIKNTSDGNVFLQVTRGSNPDELLFSVSDTGIGIPVHKQVYIFEPFTQHQASAGEVRSSSGLGLSIVRHLVHLMGGTITVTSEPGKGSKFCFNARLVATEQMAAPLQPPAFAGEIIVLDSCWVTRKAIGSMLAGTRVNCFGDKLEFETFILAQEGNPRGQVLLLIAWETPDLAECISRIQSLYEQAQVLVLIKPGDIDRFLCLNASIGANNYLTKPIRQAELYAHLRETIAISKNIGPGSHPAFIGSGERVLLAEDSEDSRMLISAFLRNTGVQLDIACNGQEAVSKFKTNLYDLILMDIQMPKLNGLEATKLIRQIERAQGRQPVKLIALTAYAYDDEVMTMMEAGCNGHLAKPLKRAELLRLLSAELSR
ncbi:MAG: PAS domain S-box protein [Firmicutes bacterium]|nr:PAS domain S-box protein [Bacillota bacterium]